MSPPATLTDPAQPPAPASPAVQSLAKGLEILSAFSEGQLLGNQQLVRMTGLPKATVSRLTTTLVELGYLRADPVSRKLAMGTRLIGMGVSVQRRIGLQDVAQPYMKALSEATGQTVSLAARDRLGMVLLEMVRPPDPSRLVLNTDAGTVLPLAQTSIGLAYIVAAPVKERIQILDGLHKRHADTWPALRESIELAHAEYQRWGFVTTVRSWGRDVNAVAAPLMLPHRQGLFAFHCAGSSSSMPLGVLRKRIGPQLLAMVAQIRQRLEISGPPRVQADKVHRP